MTAVSARERLISTYYDTPNGALKERGLTLRVREQDGQYTQTVKAEDPTQGILSRGEWEDALADDQPDPSAQRSGPHLPENTPGAVRPVFVTAVTRTRFEIAPAPETSIEAAIDEGEIQALNSEKREPVCEVELERKRGDAAALYDIALRLMEVAPLRIETRSKSERGYRLAGDGDDPPREVHAEPLDLDPEVSVEAALQTIGRSCLAQLLRNEPAVLASQPEGVHQMRVAVRRLRSALSALKKSLPEEEVRWVTGELRWLGRSLGPARNLDIFLAELLPAARDMLPDQPGWEELAADLDRLRRAAYEDVRETILSQHYTLAMLRLLRWFEACGWRKKSPTDESGPLSCALGCIAPLELDRRRRKVKQRSKGFKGLAPPERHKLRIAVKKLRYAIELLGCLSKQNDFQEFVSGLKRLQNDLGYANDVRVAHEFTVDLFAQIEPRSPSAHAWVALLEAQNQRLAVGESKLRHHLQCFKASPPFWRQ